MAENWVSRAEFAQFLGCSEKTVSNYVKAGMPSEGGGKKGNPLRIETVSALAWYVDYEHKKKGGMGYRSPQDTGVDYAQELALEKQMSRKLKEHELRIKEGEVIPLEWVNQIVGGAFNATVQNLLPVGKRVVPELLETGSKAMAIALFEDELKQAMLSAAAAVEVLGVKIVQQYESEN